MKTEALTPPCCLGLKRIWSREVIAEIRLMPWRAPVASTIGGSPRLPQVQEAVMIGADLRGVADA